MVARITTILGIRHFVSSAVYSDREPFSADMAGFRLIDVTMWGLYGLRASAQQMMKRGKAAMLCWSARQRGSSPCLHGLTWPRLDRPNGPDSVWARRLASASTSSISWTDTAGERKFFSDEVIKKAAKAYRSEDSPDLMKSPAEFVPGRSGFRLHHRQHGSIDGGISLLGGPRGTGDAIELPPLIHVRDVSLQSPCLPCLFRKQESTKAIDRAGRLKDQLHLCRSAIRLLLSD